MGEDTLIFVKKEQCEDLYFTAMQIEKYFGNRWSWFKEKFHLEGYPDENDFWTPEQILKEVAGKEVKEEYIDVIKDLMGKECIIQGDCVDFPKNKNEEDYYKLIGIFYKLWERLKIEGSEKWVARK